MSEEQKQFDVNHPVWRKFTSDYEKKHPYLRGNKYFDEQTWLKNRDVAWESYLGQNPSVAKQFGRTDDGGGEKMGTGEAIAATAKRNAGGWAGSALAMAAVGPTATAAGTAVHNFLSPLYGTGVGAWVPGVAGVATAGLIELGAGIIGAFGGDFVERKAIDAISPETNAKLDEEYSRAREEHPYVSFGTDLAGYAATGGIVGAGKKMLTGGAKTAVGGAAGKTWTGMRRAVSTSEALGRDVGAGGAKSAGRTALEEFSRADEVLKTARSELVRARNARITAFGRENVEAARALSREARLNYQTAKSLSRESWKTASRLFAEENPTQRLVTDSASMAMRRGMRMGKLAQAGINIGAQGDVTDYFAGEEYSTPATQLLDDIQAKQIAEGEMGDGWLARTLRGFGHEFTNGRAITQVPVAGGFIEASRRRDEEARNERIHLDNYERDATGNYTQRGAAQRAKDVRRALVPRNRALIDQYRNDSIAHMAGSIIAGQPRFAIELAMSPELLAGGGGGLALRGLANTSLKSFFQWGMLAEDYARRRQDTYTFTVDEQNRLRAAIEKAGDDGLKAFLRASLRTGLEVGSEGLGEVVNVGGLWGIRGGGRLLGAGKGETGKKVMEWLIRVANEGDDATLNAVQKFMRASGINPFGEVAEEYVNNVAAAALNIEDPTEDDGDYFRRLAHAADPFTKETATQFAAFIPTSLLGLGAGYVKGKAVSGAARSVNAAVEREMRRGMESMDDATRERLAALGESINRADLAETIKNATDPDEAIGELFASMLDGRLSEQLTEQERADLANFPLRERLRHELNLLLNCNELQQALVAADSILDSDSDDGALTQQTVELLLNVNPDFGAVVSRAEGGGYAGADGAQLTAREALQNIVAKATADMESGALDINDPKWHAAAGEILREEAEDEQKRQRAQILMDAVVSGMTPEQLEEFRQIPLADRPNYVVTLLRGEGAAVRLNLTIGEYLLGDGARKNYADSVYDDAEDAIKRQFPQFGAFATGADARARLASLVGAIKDDARNQAIINSVIGGGMAPEAVGALDVNDEADDEAQALSGAAASPEAQAPAREASETPESPAPAEPAQEPAPAQESQEPAPRQEAPREEPAPSPKRIRTEYDGLTRNQLVSLMRQRNIEIPKGASTDALREALKQSDWKDPRKKFVRGEAWTPDEEQRTIADRVLKAFKKFGVLDKVEFRDTYTPDGELANGGYHGATKTLYLSRTGDATTLAHELRHAVWQMAKNGTDEALQKLYASFRRTVNAQPMEIRAYIAAKYKGQPKDAIEEEIFAFLGERNGRDSFFAAKRDLAESKKAQDWWARLRGAWDKLVVRAAELLNPEFSVSRAHIAAQQDASTALDMAIRDIFLGHKVDMADVAAQAAGEEIAPQSSPSSQSSPSGQPPEEEQAPEEPAPMSQGVADFDAREGTEVGAMLSDIRDGTIGEKHRHYRIANSSDLLKQNGVTGDNFTISSGVITRHDKKKGHHLTEEEWLGVAEALSNPFAITKHPKGPKNYRLWLRATIQGKVAIVGVTVKSSGKGLEVNSIDTVFGRDSAKITRANVVYLAEDLTDEQKSVLAEDMAAPAEGQSVPMDQNRPIYPANAGAGETLPQNGKDASGKEGEPAAESDNLDDIDAEAVRQELAQGGIENGQVVNPVAAERDPFIETVSKDAEQEASKAEKPMRDRILDAIETDARDGLVKIVPDGRYGDGAHVVYYAPGSNAEVERAADGIRKAFPDKDVLSDGVQIIVAPKRAKAPQPVKEQPKTPEGLTENAGTVQKTDNPPPAIQTGPYTREQLDAMDEDALRGIAEGRHLDTSLLGKSALVSLILGDQERESGAEANPAPQAPAPSPAPQQAEWQGGGRNAAWTDEQRNQLVADIHAAYRDALRSGTGEKPIKSIVELRRRAGKFGMVADRRGANDAELQELLELALVRTAREALESGAWGNNPKSQYAAMLKLYGMQMTVGRRDTQREKLQQFSTPIPMSFLADWWVYNDRAGEVEFVLEPTAGNGMLLVNIPARLVRANEISERRLANLRAQGFPVVTQQDARDAFGGGPYDAVVANPPFGKSDREMMRDGRAIHGLDRQMTVNMLDAMADDGRAAIIIGGELEYHPNGAIKNNAGFWSWLYDHYNVKGVIEMAGDLYAGQGTKYPTLMILIDGRRSEEERARSQVHPPVKEKAVGKVDNFNDLYQTVSRLLNTEGKTDGYEEILQSPRVPDGAVAGDASGRADGGRRASQHRPGAGKHQGGVAGEQGAVLGPRAGSELSPGRPGDSSVVDADHREGTDGGGLEAVGGRGGNVDDGRAPDGRTGELRDGTGGRGEGGIPQTGGGSRGGPGGNRLSGGRGGTGGSSVDDHRPDDGGVPVGERRPPSRPQARRTLESENIPYRQHSSARSLESVAPAHMAEAMDKTLSAMERETGLSVDEAVRRALAYGSDEELHNALAAEQVDSVGMAINQLRQGQSLIIGDQTGVGKGRQMAALVRYAVKSGHKPIFFTKDSKLFTDLYRDMVDTGSGDLRPLIINTDGVMTDQDGNIVYRCPKSKMAEIMRGGTIPDGYDYAVVTYSQFSNERQAKARMDFMRAIAENNFLLLDESHQAAGDSARGKFLREIVGKARGVVFASATSTKRPDTMPLYSIKSAIGRVKLEGDKDIAELVEAGGAPLMEILSRAITDSGQMVRRERDMTGVESTWETEDNPEKTAEARRLYDETLSLFNEICDFQGTFVQNTLDQISDNMAQTGGTAGQDSRRKNVGVDNIPLFSKTHVYIRQLLLALKSQSIVDRVDREIKEGRHPVIALESTMEAALAGIPPDTPMENDTMALSLLRALEGTMQYTVKKDDKKTVLMLNPAQLGRLGERTYRQLREKILQNAKLTYISPIDAIIRGLEAKGYTVGEISGRSLYVDRDEQGHSVVRRRGKVNQNELMRRFNDGRLDVLILSKSGSTGISLHASSRFKDQRQRSMIIAQSMLDISEYQQMLGRIDRTGQVHRGRYINLSMPIAAEQRQNMMLRKKLKMMNAATTTSQERSSDNIEVEDLINKYGARVMIEFLSENMDLYQRLRDPLRVPTDSEDAFADAMTKRATQAKEEDAQKILGRVAWLPTQEQDEFYDEIVGRFRRLVEYLDEIGDNDLHIKALPLDARPIRSSVFIPGHDSRSANVLEQDAVIEEIDAKNLVKPMTMAEIQVAVKDMAKGADSSGAWLSDLADVSLKEQREAEEKRNATAMAAVGEAMDRAAQIKERDKREDAMGAAEARRQAAVRRHNGKLDALDRLEQEVDSAARQFTGGKVYRIPSAEAIFNGDVDMRKVQEGATTYGVFLGFRSGKKVSRNGVTLVFAPLDGNRRFEVPLSNRELLEDIAGRSRYVSFDLSDWDARRTSGGREKRVVLTGNVLLALSGIIDPATDRPRGKVISFTDSKGNVRDGVLMPKDFDLLNVTPNASIPISKAEKQLVKSDTVVVSVDGKVSIVPHTLPSYMGGGKYYVLDIPASRKESGKFETPEMVALTDRRSGFYSYRGRKEARIPEENLRKVLKLLSEAGVSIRNPDAKISWTPAAGEESGATGQEESGGFMAQRADGDMRFQIAVLGEYNTGDLRELAHRVKVGDSEAIADAGRRLAGIIPKNAVLVPMPSHAGTPTTMRALADAIAAHVEGAVVVDALRSDPHESNYVQKKRGVAPSKFGMRLVADIPDGRDVFVVDNVIDTGATYRAAMSAIPNAHLLALADTDKTPDELRQTAEERAQEAGRDWSDAKVPDLRRELVRRGLSPAGTPAMLRKRLEEDDRRTEKAGSGFMAQLPGRPGAIRAGMDDAVKEERRQRRQASLDLSMEYLPGVSRKRLEKIAEARRALIDETGRLRGTAEDFAKAFDEVARELGMHEGAIKEEQKQLLRIVGAASWGDLKKDADKAERALEGVIARQSIRLYKRGIEDIAARKTGETNGSGVRTGALFNVQAGLAAMKETVTGEERLRAIDKAEEALLKAMEVVETGTSPVDGHELTDAEMDKAINDWEQAAADLLVAKVRGVATLHPGKGGNLLDDMGAWRDAHNAIEDLAALDKRSFFKEIRERVERAKEDRDRLIREITGGHRVPTRAEQETLRAGEGIRKRAVEAWRGLLAMHMSGGREFGEFITNAKDSGFKEGFASHLLHDGLAAAESEERRMDKADGERGLELLKRHFGVNPAAKFDPLMDLSEFCAPLYQEDAGGRVRNVKVVHEQGWKDNRRVVAATQDLGACKMKLGQLMSYYLYGLQAEAAAQQDFTDTPRFKKGADTSLMESLCAAGFSAETMRQIREVLAERGLDRLAIAISGDMSSKVPALNGFMRKFFHSSLKEVDFYAPIRRVHFGLDENAEARNGIGGFMGLARSFLKERVANRRDFQPLNLVDSWINHNKQVNHLLAYADWVSHIGRVFRDQRTQNALSWTLGETGRNALNVWLDNQANGGRPIALKSSRLTKAWDVLSRNFAGAVTTNPRVALKQLTSPSMALSMLPPEASTRQWLADMFELLASPSKRREFLDLLNSQSVIWQTRGSTANDALSMVRNYRKGSKASLRMMRFNRWLGGMTRFGDKGGALMGCYGVFRAYERKFLKEGMEPAAAKRAALERFEDALNSGQQSALTEYMSYAQTHGRGLRFLYMFKSAQAAMTRNFFLHADSWAKGRGSRKQHLRGMLGILASAFLFREMARAMNPLLTLMGLGGGGDDDDKKKKKDEALWQVTKDLVLSIPDSSTSGIMLFGDMINHVCDYALSTVGHSRGLEKAPRKERIATALFPSFKTFDDLENAIGKATRGDLEAAMRYASRAVASATGAAGILNAMDIGEGVVDAFTADDLTPAQRVGRALSFSRSSMGAPQAKKPKPKTPQQQRRDDFFTTIDGRPVGPVTSNWD